MRHPSSHRVIHLRRRCRLGDIEPSSTTEVILAPPGLLVHRHQKSSSTAGPLSIPMPKTTVQSRHPPSRRVVHLRRRCRPGAWGYRATPILKPTDLTVNVAKLSASSRCVQKSLFQLYSAGTIPPSRLNSPFGEVHAPVPCIRGPLPPTLDQSLVRLCFHGRQFFVRSFVGNRQSRV